MAKKLLIIDDSAVIRQMIVFALQHEDIDIVEACDGEEGIQKLDHERYDLIITDINMPKKDGFDLLAAAKTHVKNKFTKVCVLTTESDVAKKLKAKELGASSFILKPFDPKLLKNMVNKLMV